MFIKLFLSSFIHLSVIYLSVHQKFIFFSDEIQLDKLRRQMIHDEEERNILKNKIADVSKVNVISYLICNLDQHIAF